MTEAFMDWALRKSEAEPLAFTETPDSGWCHVRVVDVYSKHKDVALFSVHLIHPHFSCS